MSIASPSRVPPSSLELLDRARDSLVVALTAPTVGERYVAAHLAALRAAAAVLSVRGRPQRHQGRPRSVWEVLPAVAPEFAEWAAFFAAGAARRAAVEVGRGDAVSSREADDLVRDGEAFVMLVESTLGLPHREPLPLAAVSVRGFQR